MRKRSDYGPGDQISRAQAWEDLKHDFERISHAVTDVFVNLWRLAGVSDRDASQRLGRITLVAGVTLCIAVMLAGVSE